MPPAAELPAFLLQALRDFPQEEIDDPYHSSNSFIGPPKRFHPGGLAWEQMQQQAASSQTVPASEQKLLQVAVIGVPNAGKSSMVNALVGSKVRQLLE